MLFGGETVDKPSVPSAHPSFLPRHGTFTAVVSFHSEGWLSSHHRPTDRPTYLFHQSLL